MRRREGRYLLRTNLCGQEPAQLWQFYIQLVEVEAAFKTMKDDLQLRPIYHQLEQRIEAHIFVAFLAYCLQVTLKAKLKPLAGGLTPRAVLEKLAAVQMLDVHLPTTDGRELVLTRHTEPDANQRLLIRAHEAATAQAISAEDCRQPCCAACTSRPRVVQTFEGPTKTNQSVTQLARRELGSRLSSQCALAPRLRLATRHLSTDRFMAA